MRPHVLNNGFVPHDLLVAFSVRKLETYLYKLLFAEQWAESWLVTHTHTHKKNTDINGNNNNNNRRVINLIQKRVKVDIQKQNAGTRNLFFPVLNCSLFPLAGSCLSCFPSRPGIRSHCGAIIILKAGDRVAI